MSYLFLINNAVAVPYYIWYRFSTVQIITLLL